MSDVFSDIERAVLAYTDGLVLEGGRVSDAVFDALLSERPYKKPWTVDRAVELIRSESGRHFDPACVEAMLDHLDDIIASRRMPQAMDNPQRG